MFSNMKWCVEFISLSHSWWTHMYRWSDEILNCHYIIWTHLSSEVKRICAVRYNAKHVVYFTVFFNLLPWKVDANRISMTSLINCSVSVFESSQHSPLHAHNFVQRSSLRLHLQLRHTVLQEHRTRSEQWAVTSGSVLHSDEWPPLSLTFQPHLVGS